MSENMEKDKPSKLKKKIADAWDDFKADFSETKKNFRRNILGINDGDIPGEPKFNKTTIRIWISYFLSVLSGLFAAIVGYGFVRDSLRRYVANASMNDNSFVEPTDSMWFGLLTVWDVMLAVLVAAVIIVIIWMFLKLVLIRNMDYAHDVSSTSLAVSVFCFLLFFVIFWITHAPVPSIM